MSRMKQSPRKERGLWVGLGVGVALLSLAALALFYKSIVPAKDNAATGRPSLKVNLEQIDLGDVKLGQTVEAAFELTNAGDGPLTITEAPYIEVVAGC